MNIEGLLISLLFALYGLFVVLISKDSSDEELMVILITSSFIMLIFGVIL